MKVMQTRRRMKRRRKRRMMLMLYNQMAMQVILERISLYTI
jgi:hypothetical protein